MTTTVIKANGLIRNPVQNNTIVGSIVTSDTFIGSGLLVDQLTDAGLGGEQIHWKKFNAYGAGVFEKINGSAHFVAGATGAVYVDKSMVDVAVSWKMSKLLLDISDTGESGFGVFVDVRRSNDNLKMYRIGFNSTHLGLVWRDGGMSTLAACPVAQGDKILYIANGNKHNIYVNDALKISVTHEGTVQNGYVGLSGASSTASVAIDDLVVYSID